MNDTTASAVITADTGAAIPGALVFVDFHHGDGCEWMEAIGEDSPAELRERGPEPGPVALRHRRGDRHADRPGNLSGVATYCEGNVTCTCYHTQRAQWEAITEYPLGLWCLL